MPDELDRLLDEALSAYVMAPDRPGLEKRVLARVSERNPGPKKWLVYVSAAAALMAGLSILGPLRVTEKRRPVPALEAAVSHHALVPKAVQPAVIPVAPLSKRSLRKTRADAKQPGLLLASPLTSQERALLYIAQSSPAQLVALNRPTEPLAVPLIHIEPLVKGND